MSVFPGSKEIINQFRKQRSVFVVVGLLALIASIIFSSPGFIKPKYKSTLVMYPTSSNKISGAIMGDDIWSDEDLLEFGEREHADQMMQILSSNQIRDRIIREYDLLGHYRIDTSESFFLTRLHKEYERNIHFRRTEFNAVEVNVYDTDPQLSAYIANRIAELVDTLKNAMQKERAVQGLRVARDAYHKQAGEVRELEDSLAFIMRKGVHDYESQSQTIHEQLSIEVANGNKPAIKALNSKLDLLAEYGGPYISIIEELKHEKERLSYLKLRFDKARIDAREVLPQKFIVSSAYKAEKKVYPLRWAIIFGAVISSILVLVLVIIQSMILENIQSRHKEDRIPAVQEVS